MLSQYEIRQYVTHWCSVSRKNSLKQKIKSGTVILCGSWTEILSSVIASKRLVSSSCFGVVQILMKYDSRLAVGNSRMHEFFIIILQKSRKMISSAGSKNLARSSGITKISSKKEDY